jgi:NodT family efflux transporter outer membrane factor (OMF) lipoprotein
MRSARVKRAWHLRWAASLTMFMIGSAGCIYDSKLAAQRFKLPEHYGPAGSRSATARQTRAPERWWALLGDPTLNRLMEQAFSQNLDLAKARARVVQAEAQLKLAQAGFYPSVQADASVGRSRSIFNVGALGTFANEQNAFKLSAAASYEVDLFGKVRYAHQAAKLDLAASGEDLRATAISIAAQLADSYYLVVQLRAQLELSRRTIASRTNHLELVMRRYREGVVSALDLYQAQANRAEARENRVALRAQLQLAENALATLLGGYPGQVDSGSLDRLPAQVFELQAGVPGQLLLQRPDLRAMHARLIAADWRVGAAFAEHFPTLNLSTSIGGQFDPVGWVYSLFAGLTAPLFSGFRVAAKVELNKGLVQEQLAAFKALLLVAVREVEDALINGRSYQRRMTLLEERVAAAEGSLRLATDQYTQGLISYLPLLTAEEQVFSARTALISARRNLISARIQLARALGGGWVEPKKSPP